MKELAAIRKKEEAETPARAERVQRASSKVAEAEEVLRVAQREHAQVHGGARGASSSAQQRVSRLEYELRECAPPEVGAFIQEMQNLQERLRRDPALWPMVTVQASRDWSQGQQSVTALDKPAFESMIATIRNAIAEAEALALSDRRDIAGEIEALRQSVGARLAELRKGENGPTRARRARS